MEKVGKKGEEKNAALEKCGVLPIFVIMDGHSDLTLHTNGSVTVSSSQERQANLVVTATPEKLNREEQARIIANKNDTPTSFATQNAREVYTLHKTSTGHAGSSFMPAASAGGADGGPTTSAGHGGPFYHPAPPAREAAGGKSYDQSTAKPSKFMSELEHIASLYNPFR